MSFLERPDMAGLKRCSLCGEYRPDEGLTEFVHSRTSEVLFACVNTASRIGCLSRTISRLGHAPSVGGRWALTEVAG